MDYTLARIGEGTSVEATRMILNAVNNAGDRPGVALQLLHDYTAFLRGEDAGELGRMLGQMDHEGVCDAGCALSHALSYSAGLPDEAKGLLTDWVMPRFPDYASENAMRCSPRVACFAFMDDAALSRVGIALADERKGYHTGIELVEHDGGLGVLLTGGSDECMVPVRDGALITSDERYPNPLRHSREERAKIERARTTFTVMPVINYAALPGLDGPFQLHGQPFRRALRIAEAACKGDTYTLERIRDFYEQLADF